LALMTSLVLGLSGCPNVDEGGSGGGYYLHR